MVKLRETFRGGGSGRSSADVDAVGGGVVAVVVMVVVMVAKVDKGERVVQWKGPLIGVRWHVGGRRAARAAEGGGRGAQDPAEGRELLQERRVKEGGRSRGSE